MRILSALFVLAYLAGCASGGNTIPAGKEYVAPISGLSCGPFNALEHRAIEAIGPHGGTIHIVEDDLRAMRIDVEELSNIPNGREIEVQEAILKNKAQIYRGYLDASIMPLIKSGVADAVLLDARGMEIGGRDVYFSAVLMPKSSAQVSAKGERIDGIRGQIQFINANFIYTVSETIVARDGESRKAQIAESLARVSTSFKACRFPA